MGIQILNFSEFFSSYRVNLVEFFTLYLKIFAANH